jgi:hypothetical protein
MREGIILLLVVMLAIIIVMLGYDTVYIIHLNQILPLIGGTQNT